MLQILRKIQVRGTGNTFQLLSRLINSKCDDYGDQIALSDDKRTIVCWHKDKPFPYECSLPLPEVPLKEDNTVLKVQSTSALRNIHRSKPADLERLELMKITHTTKHVWYPIARKVKRRKPNMDRPYL